MRDSMQPSSDESSGVRFDPPRLLESSAHLSPLARQLLSKTPLVQPLDPSVAMRVRAAVLHSSVAPVGATRSAGAGSVGNSATLAKAKLGLVAGSAALVGAGLATLAASFWHGTGVFEPAGGQQVVVVSGADLTSAELAGVGEERSPARLPVHSVNVGGASLGASNVHSKPNTGSSSDSTERETPGVLAVDDAQAKRAETTRLAEVDRETASLSHLAVVSVSDLRTLGATSGDGTTADRDAVDSRLSHPRNTRGASAWVSGEDAASTGAENDVDGAMDERLRVRPEFRRFASASKLRNSTKGRQPRATINTLDEETSLLEEARSKLGREPERALDLAIEHQKRFRRGQLLEQRRMIHLEALLRLGRDEEASALAKGIGSSLYRARAEALLEKYGL